MNQSDILLEVFVFLAALALGLACEAVVRARRERVAWDLERLHAGRAAQVPVRPARRGEDEETGDTRLPAPFRYVERVARQSGVHVTLRTVLTLIAGGAAGGWALGVTVTGSPWVALLPALGGLYAPVWYLNWRAAQRARKAEGQLQAYCQAMAQALRGGLSALQAMEEAARDLGPPFGPEARRAARLAQHLGVAHAMHVLEGGFRLPDLRLLAAAVRIHQEAGGDLPQVLDGILQTMRDRREARAALRAATAQGRMQANILFALPWVLLFIFRLVDPGYLDPLFHTPGGLAVFLFAVAWMALGYVFMNRLLAGGVAE